MNNTEAKNLFDKILTAEDGAKIRIPCTSVADANCVRSLLYRERAAYLMTARELARSVSIQRLTLNETLAFNAGHKHFVVLSVNVSRPHATLEHLDGTTEEINASFTSAGEQ